MRSTWYVEEMTGCVPVYTPLSGRRDKQLAAGERKGGHLKLVRRFQRSFACQVVREQGDLGERECEELLQQLEDIRGEERTVKRSNGGGTGGRKGRRNSSNIRQKERWSANLSQ